MTEMPRNPGKSTAHKVRSETHTLLLNYVLRSDFPKLMNRFTTETRRR